MPFEAIFAFFLGGVLSSEPATINSCHAINIVCITSSAACPLLVRRRKPGYRPGTIQSSCVRTVVPSAALPLEAVKCIVSMQRRQTVTAFICLLLQQSHSQVVCVGAAADVYSTGGASPALSVVIENKDTHLNACAEQHCAQTATLQPICHRRTRKGVSACEQGCSVLATY